MDDRLPNLTFIAMDDWIEKIGDKAFMAWLKMITWADRSDGNYGVIPISTNDLIKKLGIGKETYYKKIVPPLWNYGFIDLQEVKSEGYVVVNVIVYDHPQNDATKATKPLEKIRDYDTEWKIK